MTDLEDIFGNEDVIEEETKKPREMPQKKSASDDNSPLWHGDKEESFYRQLKIVPQQQHGPTCVSTSLLMLATAASGKKDVIYPKDSPGFNTQDPVSWSDYLFENVGMKLAYCSFDCRLVEHYIPELLRLDDLFLMSYYTGDFTAEPNEKGFVCSSHIVIFHRHQVIDPATGKAYDMRKQKHPCVKYHTKRIFRVVPAKHRRGL